MQFQSIGTFWHRELYMKTWYGFCSLIYLGHFVPKYILKKYLKQFSTQRLDIVQNVLTPGSLKCFNYFCE